MQRFKILYSVIRCTKICAEASTENAQAVVPKLWTTWFAVSTGKASL